MIVRNIFSLIQLTQAVSVRCDFHFPFYSKRLDTMLTAENRREGHLNLTGKMGVTVQTQIQAVAFVVILVLKNILNLLKSSRQFAHALLTQTHRG